MTARRAIVLGVLIAFAAPLTACGGSSKKSSGATTRPKVTVEARDFSFVVPEQLPSGWVDITVHNTGAQVHQITFVKLGSLSFDKFKKAASKNNFKSIPADTVFAGGPTNAPPGGTTFAVVHLEPGTYAVVCFIPDPTDGMSHVSKGMIAQVEVAPAVYSVEAPPYAQPGNKIELSDFAFNVDAGFSGQGSVAITNVGSQVHEAAIYRIADGKTLADVKNFLFPPKGSPPPAGAPPFTPASGVAALGPKQTVVIPFFGTASRLALVCFLPDPTKNNRLHALEGMIKELTIS
jgi:hypothetical protein